MLIQIAIHKLCLYKTWWSQLWFLPPKKLLPSEEIELDPPSWTFQSNFSLDWNEKLLVS